MERTLDELGTLVRERREALRLTVAECVSRATKLSDTTWNNIESGRPARRKSYLGVCTALDWSDDSIDRILRGDDPIEADRSMSRPSAVDAQAELLVVVRDLRQAVDRLTERLPPPGP